MIPELVLMQADPSQLTGDALAATARFGFAVFVAWYLLTKTTSAIKEVTAEIAMLREEIAATRTEIGREVYETRQDVKELRETTGDQRGRT